MDPLGFGDPISYAEFIKTQGNQDFRNGNYSLAIKKYDEALGVLVYVYQTARIPHHRDMAVLLCNRSNAFYNLNRWREAFCSAQESLGWDQTYVKAYYRAGCSLMKLSQPLEAARMFYQGLTFLHSSSDAAQISDFIVGVLSSVNNERSITPNFLSICRRIVSNGFSASVWHQVIEKLTRKGLWQSCLLLATEKDRLPASLRVPNIPLKDLFEKYVLCGQYEKIERLPNLVKWLISIGANIESIGNYPLHAVIMLCMKAGGSHLFRWLLKYKPEMNDLINQQNEEGATVLHIVVSHSDVYPLKNLIDDVVMLLNAGVDPRIVDAQSRTAVDILKKKKKFRTIEVINRHMAKYASCSEEELLGQTETQTAADPSASLHDAFEQFVEFCHSENRMQNIRKLKHEKVQSLLKLLATVREIPEDVVCEIPLPFASSFIKLLLEKRMWHEALLLLTRTATGEGASGGGLVNSCSLSDVDIGPVLRSLSKSDGRRMQLVRCLLERGASSEGTGAIQEKPLQHCIRNDDFEMAYLLLSAGADPHDLTTAEGDTPLHAALSICVDKKDDIGLHILKYLIELFNSDPCSYPHLNPNCQDKNGNTLMHVIFQKNLSKQVKKTFSLLAKYDINFNIKNHAGRDARHRRKKNDPMLVAWNEALGEQKKKHRHEAGKQTAKAPKSGPACSRPQAKSSADAPAERLSKTPLGKLSSNPEQKLDSFSCPQEEAENSETKNSTNSDTGKPVTRRELLAQEIAHLIESLVLGEGSSPVESSAPKSSNCVVRVEGGESECQQTRGSEEPTYGGLEGASSDKMGAEDLPQNELKEAEEEEAAEGDGKLQELETYVQDFDSMTWEIECTSEMLKKLGDKSIPRYMKKKIIYIIQQLGNGEWTQGLQKKLKCSKGDIQLYEANLNKGARMLWELAIDFSPRCTENVERMIENEDSTHPEEKTGRVYTEIIRIWDIVLDHCKLNRAIEAICKAYNRGRSCTLRKRLRGINTTQLSSNLKTQKRIPRVYIEYTKAGRSKDGTLPEYFPPASSVETEFNIMKFHSFSTNMALNILNDMTSAIEYPFRVGELEYAVIDLNPKPLEPIILIGRSGTGKTTCCLYRLWKKFHSYWERAELAGGPLLVRQTWYKLKSNVHLENDRKEDEEDKQEVFGPVDSSDLETSATTDNEEQEEGDQGPSDLGEPAADVLCDGEEGCAPEESGQLGHLHQIFVTKNHVLCQEVQRNFVELSKSSKVTGHFKPLEGNVYRLQDVKDENFPLFLTSRQLLLLLDFSLPEPFFLRNEDGSLKHTIAGWSTKEDLVISHWREEEEEIDAEGDYDEEEKTPETHIKGCDPRVFVTYSVFVNEIWPKMIKGKCPYNPSLVWKEIKSFLKGSFEALSSHQGILTEEDYKKLGRKRCPNFKEDRGEIYQLFCCYQQIRSQGNYFDEEDVLHKLSQRLSKLGALPWCIHELYGDEIQDFTQAELALLMKCIDNPNAMFLTGDTAQSIMKGVAFRFSDLRSLFHYASKIPTDKHCAVRKPKKIYQLYQNYRSHSGILHLASGVVDLLQYYFPESFDRLPRDKGLFDGPKPTVLESCSVSDLAILLRGNKRKTQPIEFGAHQVILVANEVAKEKIPEELNLALVLTIYEAKGLEFDDVLLYNFFTDSEASKEWKIISSFTPASSLPEETKVIIERPLEKDTDAPGKLLNPEMYKLLNGELKQLYTAITRARVNLWIFDENSDKRAPAFQYFIKRKLVEVVKTDEEEELDTNMFVKTSTPEEWIAQGDYYAEHQCWKVAAKCYQKGGAREKEKLVLANDAVLHVQAKKLSPKEKQMEYIDLAKTYLECRDPDLALKCLFYAKEYQLCAQLCEKLGKVKDAAYFYRRGQCYKDAYRCFEQIHEFDLALRMCCLEELYEEAAKSVERYETMLRTDRRLASKLSYTSSQFYLEAAAKHLHANKMNKVMEALSHLDSEDQLVFLKAHGCFSEAAGLLKRDNRDEEAAKLMKEHGFVMEAAKLTNQKEFRASCLLAAVRRSVAGTYHLENVWSVLREALELSEETNQKSGSAEATYLMGLLEKDFETLKKSFHMFLQVNHNAGAVEALFQAAQCSENSVAVLQLASLGIEALLKLVKAFQRVVTNAEREMVKSCYEYFGIVPRDEKRCQVSQDEAGYILEFLSENSGLRETAGKQLIVSLEEAKSALKKHLWNRLLAVTRSLLELSFPDICMRFIVGLACEDESCVDFHRVLQRHEVISVFQSKMHLAAINGLLLEAKQVFPQDLFSEPNPIDDLLTADKYKLCKSLINVIFPKHFHLRMVSENPVACKQILSLNHNFRNSVPCKAVLRECIRSEFRNETAQNRRESTDCWLRMMRVFSLTSNYPEEFERLLFKEEEEYEKDLRTKPKFVEGRYGMLLPDKYAGNAEKTHLCFIRLLQGSMDQLYVHRNVERCKWLFYRFMNVLVKKCRDPLIPSIGNTVALLEFQFILCCAVLMRLCKNMTLCLPKSYISLFHYWDFLFTRGGQSKDVFTFSVIQEYKPENPKQAIRNFKHHVKYLADVLCGCECDNFNVLLDAFQDLDFLLTGEAERTLVLCLVMLVNADQVISWRYKEILADQFLALKESLLEMKKEWPSKVPQRLFNTVCLVSEASTLKEVVEGLKELFYSRDMEFLADCYWKWDPHGSRPVRYEDGRAVRGIYYVVADLDRFTHLSQERYFEEPEMDFDDDSYVEEKEDPLANIASIRQQKQRQKASAKRKLRCYFLFIRCCVRWRRISCSNPDAFETPLGIFKKAGVDQTQCDLCGIKFLQGPASFITQAEHGEREFPEVAAPTEDGWEDCMEGCGNVAAGSTFETHVGQSEHEDKRAAYQRYFRFFRGTVEPLIRKGTEVMESISENAYIRGHFAASEQSNLEQTRIEEAIKKITEKVEDIYKRKAWADAEETMSKLARSLKIDLDNASRWLEKTESNLLKEEELNHDKDLENEVKGEEVNFEELHYKKVSRKRRKK